MGVACGGLHLCVAEQLADHRQAHTRGVGVGGQRVSKCPARNEPKSGSWSCPGGFTTRDLKRCRHMARLIALNYNWWSLFVRLADPDRHREAITSRPLLLHGVARQTQHAGQTRLTVTSHHGQREAVVAALRRIAGFFESLTRSAEQSSAEDRWRRILAEALKKYLRGREPGRQPWLPPPRASPAC